MTLMVIGLVLVGTDFVSAANANSTNAKIKKLEMLEKIEHGKLYKNQQKLENSQNSLQASKEDYNVAQNKLSKLERDLNKSITEYRSLDFQMRRRIRQIFKSQRQGFFELLLVEPTESNHCP